MQSPLDPPRTLPGEGGITDRFKDQLEVGRKAIEVAKQIGGPIIVVGDFYDNAQLDPITLTESIRMMVDSGVEWWILPGNHDSASLSGGRFNVEALGIMGCDKVRTLSIYDCFVRSGWELRFLPFASIPENREQLAILRDRPIVQGSKRILFAHQAIFGCKVDSGWIDDNGINPEEMCRGWDEVVLGHFHDRQEFGPPANHREGELWIKVDRDTLPDREARLVEFSGGLYAVMRCAVPQGQFEMIGQTCQKLVTWCENSRYKQASHQWLEKSVATADPGLEFVLDL